MHKTMKFQSKRINIGYGEISRVEMAPPRESSVDEESTTTKRAQYPLIVIKFLELALVVLCIGLVDDPSTNATSRIFVTQRTVSISYATFGTFIIFPAVFLFMRLLRDVYPWKTCCLMNFLGLVLFLASAAMLLHDWSLVKERTYWPPNMQRLDLLLSAGICAMVSAFLHMIDLVITIILGMRGWLEY